VNSVEGFVFDLDGTLRPDQVAMVGDFRFDIECGIVAGARTVFFTRWRGQRSSQSLEKADYVLESFSQTQELLAGFGLPDRAINELIQNIQSPCYYTGLASRKNAETCCSL
jgi:phosphoglycolate phosphatase-like HAD superfamily hydrolase